MMVQHHINTSRDIRFQMMISDWGAEGYGIYWILMEALKRDGFYDLANAHILAREYYTTEAKIKCIASQYKLFGMSEDGNTINGINV